MNEPDNRDWALLFTKNTLKHEGSRLLGSWTADAYEATMFHVFARGQSTSLVYALPSLSPQFSNHAAELGEQICYLRCCANQMRLGCRQKGVLIVRAVIVALRLCVSRQLSYRHSMCWNYWSLCTFIDVAEFVRGEVSTLPNDGT